MIEGKGLRLDWRDGSRCDLVLLGWGGCHWVVSLAVEVEVNRDVGMSVVWGPGWSSCPQMFSATQWLWFRSVGVDALDSLVVRLWEVLVALGARCRGRGSCGCNGCLGRVLGGVCVGTDGWVRVRGTFCRSGTR